jgi:hypothetical protein
MKNAFFYLLVIVILIVIVDVTVYHQETPRETLHRQFAAAGPGSFVSIVETEQGIPTWHTYTITERIFNGYSATGPGPQSSKPKSKWMSWQNLKEKPIKVHLRDDEGWEQIASWYYLQ